MKNVFYNLGILTGHLAGFVSEHSVAILIFFGVVGFVIYLVGDMLRKKGIDKSIQNQAADFPYKPVALVLNIFGVVILIATAILLYFAGGYEPLFAKLGW